MPTTRRSTGSTRGRTGPTKGQSTLSFSNKVTKSVPKDIKKATLSPSLDRVELPQHKKPVDEEKVEEVIVDEPISQEEVEEEQPAEPQVEQVPEKPEAEVRAESISDSQINKYWKAVEKQRTAPRIHQEDLQQSEKILRYFDVSSQYGPCIGITRMKRWYRADRLGLNPPVEVLAVLLREEKNDVEDVEVAQIDKIMNSTAVGA